MIVADASLMVAWLLHEPEFAPAFDTFDILAEEAIAVPSHWPIEIASALWVNVRRGRIPLEKLDGIAESLSAFNVIVDPAIPISNIRDLARFALAEGLTVYDAAYVRLAGRLGLPLATVDGAIRTAARRLNIALLPA